MQFTISVTPITIETDPNTLNNVAVLEFLYTVVFTLMMPFPSRLLKQDYSTGKLPLSRVQMLFE